MQKHTPESIASSVTEYTPECDQPVCLYLGEMVQDRLATLVGERGGHQGRHFAETEMTRARRKLAFGTMSGPAGCECN